MFNDENLPIYDMYDTNDWYRFQKKTNATYNILICRGPPLVLTSLS